MLKHQFFPFYRYICISSGFHSNKVDWVCLIRHFYLFSLVAHRASLERKSRGNLVEISSILNLLSNDIIFSLVIRYIHSARCIIFTLYNPDVLHPTDYILILIVSIFLYFSLIRIQLQN